MSADGKSDIAKYRDRMDKSVAALKDVSSREFGDIRTTAAGLALLMKDIKGTK